MHLLRSRPLLFPALVAIFLGSLGCRSRAQAVAGEPAASPSAPAASTTPPVAPTPPQPAAPAVPLTPPTAAKAPVVPSLTAPWGAITDYTYERRADFSAVLTRVANTVDAQIDQLAARRATLPETSVKDWDIAMKELTDARSDLQFKVSRLGNAMPETWTQVRDDAAQAWRRVQEAADKVKRSTTL